MSNLKINYNGLKNLDILVPVSYFVDDSENGLFSGAIEDPEFIPVVELLKDFKDWNI